MLCFFTCRLNKGKALRKQRDIKDVKESIHLIKAPGAGMYCNKLCVTSADNIMIALLFYNAIKTFQRTSETKFKGSTPIH